LKTAVETIAARVAQASRLPNRASRPFIVQQICQRTIRRVTGREGADFVRRMVQVLFAVGMGIYTTPFIPSA